MIVSDDIALGDVGAPIRVDDRACIAQDIKHMIRETGLLVEMIGQRDSGAVQMNMKKIEIEVENDERIRPGTARMTRTDIDTFYLTADTMDFGALEIFL